MDQLGVKGGRPRSRSASPTSHPSTPLVGTSKGSSESASSTASAPSGSAPGAAGAGAATPSRPSRRRPPVPRPAIVWRSSGADSDSPAGGGRARADSGDEPPFPATADDDESTTPLVGALVDGGDETDQPGTARAREVAETLQAKIDRCKEVIRQQQRIRDDNVNEYLIQTSTVTDRVQLQKLKALFEKKNQKAAQLMAHQQRKLELYTRRAKELEVSGIAHRPPKDMLKDVGQGLRSVGGNIKHGISGLSGAVVDNVRGGIQGAAESVMSKPREIAHLLKNRFGSADNITALTNESSEGTPTLSHHGSSTLPAGIPSSVASVGGSLLRSDEGSDLSSATSEPGVLPTATVQSPRHQTSVSSAGGVAPLVGPDLGLLATELVERREECERLRDEVETIKSTLQQEITLLSQSLSEERFRYDRLEQQMNDFIELHQNEVENLRQHMHDMEEKVQYQSEERLRDIHEMMDKCSTRISRMEHQQAEHQQLVNIEMIGSSQARALVVKLVNIVLTVLTVLLLIVSTLANIIMPFLRTRVRTLSTLVLVLIVVFVVRQWSDFSDLFHHYVDYVRAVSNMTRPPAEPLPARSSAAQL